MVRQRSNDPALFSARERCAFFCGSRVDFLIRPEGLVLDPEMPRLCMVLLCCYSLLKALFVYESLLSEYLSSKVHYFGTSM